MKKLNLMSIWALALIVLGSCSIDDDCTPTNPDQVAFSSKITALTPATGANGTKAKNAQWDADDEIGVYPLNAGVELPTGVYNSKENVKYVTNGDGNFTAAKPIIFPNKGALDFIAYYPFQTTINNYEYPVNVATQNPLANIDVLFSNNAKNATKKGGVVKLKFTHKLSLLLLNVNAGSEISSLDGLAISVANLKTDGKVDLKNGNVTLGETVSTFAPVTAVSGKKAVAKAIVMPTQDLKSAKITFTLGDRLYEWTPATLALESGKKYSYNVTLNAENKVEVTAVATIEDWGEGVVTNPDVTLTPKEDDKFVADKASVDFSAAAGSETIALTTQAAQAWTAVSSEAWLTVTASGTGSGDVTLTAAENTVAKERTATVTLKATGSALADITINVKQAAASVTPPVTGDLLFAGSDFEDWDAFKASLDKKYGLKSYITQSDNGRNGSKAMLINTTPKGNDYLFTTLVSESGNALVGKSKITFYVKGQVTGKSLSVNVYKADGKYDKYNVGVVGTDDVTIEKSSTNSYTGSINTGDKWVKVTLNVAGTSFATTAGAKMFSIKVGKGAAWNVLIDDITVE